MKVTDGDTVRVAFADGTEEPVRLIGIDAPESGQQLSEEATAYLVQLVLSKQVVLVADVSDRDRFDRLLRYIYLGDVFVNESIVKAGWAVAKRYEPDLAMSERLDAAQAAAKEAGVGRWTVDTTVAKVLPLVGTTSGGNCHPSYRGECVPDGVSDVDCEGGSGNGPYYVGEVEVVGPDLYDLDRDGDGIACDR